ncbi:MAG: hypothetical protein LBH38_02715 [Holosporales bacterium]|jgi:hypothetical protein|nr:hypothetical protein [Holosporales bacterium]
MRFIFDWTEKFADLTTPWRGDEDPFAIEITQAEGEFAVAHVTLLNPRLRQESIQQRAYGRIAFQRENSSIVPLFCGRIITIPVALEGALLKVELIAEPDDAAQKLRELGNTLRTFPYWDALFVPIGAEDMPHEVLEARTALFAWNRVNGALSLSDLYRGKNTLTIENIFQDTLRMHRGSEPWDAVDVTLEVQWIQRAYGCMDIAPVIARMFPGQTINTYSGQDFQRSWQALEYKLHVSGYEVLEDSIEEIIPPETGILNIYPRRSPAYFVQEEEEDDLRPEYMHTRPTKVYLKRYWFRGKLVLSWDYRQKRQEYAHFVLRNRHQLRFFTQDTSPSLQGHVKYLHFKLNAIAPRQDIHPWRGFVWYKEGEWVSFGGWHYCALKKHRAGAQFLEDKIFWERGGEVPTALGDSSRASFFTTRRGQMAVAHAVARARSYLAASSRSFEVSFCGTFEDLAEVTIEDALSLKDPRLPGGSIEGKVVKTRIIIDGKTQTRWVEIRLACGVGKAEHAPSEGYILGEELYAEADYAESETYIQKQATTLENVHIEDFSQHIPRAEGIGISCGRVEDIIEGVHISNFPEEQEKFLAEQKIKTPEKLLECLRTCCTTIRIDLKELRSKTVLTHTIPVVIREPWSAPKGVSLTKR